MPYKRPPRMPGLLLMLLVMVPMLSGVRVEDAAARTAAVQEPDWLVSAVLAHPDGAAETGFGRAVAADDVNSDGAVDLVVGAPEAAIDGRPASGAVFVFYGPAFTEVATLTDPAGQERTRLGHAVLVADIDCDGRNDIIAGAPGRSSTFVRPEEADSFAPGRVLVFFGPMFTDIQTLEIGDAPESDGFGSSLAVGDLNGDGRLDLAAGDPIPIARASEPDVPVFIARGPSSGVYLFLGPELRPGPSLSGERVGCSLGYFCGYFGRAIAVGDSDGDGANDLVVGTPRSSDTGVRTQLQVFYGPDFGMVRTVSGQTRFGSTGFGASLVIADLDGDGAVEIVTGDPGGAAPGPASEVVVLPGGGRSGMWTARRIPDPAMPVPTRSPGRFGSQVALGDVTGDGVLDLVTPDRSRAEIHVFAGPDFVAPRVLSGAEATILLLADLDRDGRAEIVITTPAAQVKVFAPTSR